MKCEAVDLFHNILSPSGKQPEHRKLAQELKQPTAGCIAIFHKYYCYTKRGVLQQIWLYESMRGMLLMCQNTTMPVYGAWIKTYYFLCPKIYSSFGNVSYSTTSSRHAAWSARICETGLLLALWNINHLLVDMCIHVSIPILAHYW